MFWLVSTGLALGGGAIWSMHFIGMLAFKTPFNVDYDLTLTFLSMVIAIVVVIIGLAIVGRGVFGTAGLFIGGIIAGLGVSAMHYTGMAAMRMPATIIYNHSQLLSVWLRLQQHCGWHLTFEICGNVLVVHLLWVLQYAECIILVCLQ